MDEPQAAPPAPPPSLRPAAPGIVAPAPAAAPVPVASDVLVDAWWADTFPGSVVGRSTDVWNFVFVAKEDLKRRLKGSV
jgi:hypothetical protein